MKRWKRQPKQDAGPAPTLAGPWANLPAASADAATGAATGAAGASPAGAPGQVPPPPPPAGASGQVPPPPPAYLPVAPDRPPSPPAGAVAPPAYEPAARPAASPAIRGFATQPIEGLPPEITPPPASTASGPSSTAATTSGSAAPASTASAPPASTASASAAATGSGQTPPPGPPPVATESQQPTADGTVEDERTVLVPRAAAVDWTLDLDDGTAIALPGPSLVVGRRPPALVDGVPGVAIPDESRTMSKVHARLDLVGDAWVVTDLDSTNGVLVVGDDGSETLLPSRRPTAVAGRILFGTVGVRITDRRGRAR